ncbi:MAG TPA: methyltransferase [Nevskiaceae bacterium]|nr:methyltransferase [Nevskiaceae bacterium]
MSRQPDPTAILQTATAFWPSKVLLSAVGVGLFSALGKSALTAEELGRKLGLHPRGWYDFFDSLVALKFLERDGDGPSARYRNTLDTATFLDKASPAYIGGIADMMNTRLYRFWGDLETALKTGKPQNELKHSGKSMFEELYSDPARLGTFLEAMSGFQGGNFMALAEKFDWRRYKTVTDVGGALALLSRVVASRHAHLTFSSFDLPVVAPHAEKHVRAANMSERIKIVSGDFFKNALPKADVVTMGNILHDWNLDGKKMLIRKAYEALPAGGALIAIENVIDDARRENAFGLMMSLNMLIEFGDAFDYTGADFRTWCADAGFKRFETIPLAGPTSAAIAYK